MNALIRGNDAKERYEKYSERIDAAAKALKEDKSLDALTIDALAVNAKALARCHLSSKCTPQDVENRFEYTVQIIKGRYNSQARNSIYLSVLQFHSSLSRIIEEAHQKPDNVQKFVLELVDMVDHWLLSEIKRQNNMEGLVRSY